MNLIDNAIYWLGAKRSDRRLYLGSDTGSHNRKRIIVADNGPGLLDSPEIVVEAFFTRKPDGMGLGLYITDEMMKRHKGRLVFPSAIECDLPKGFTGAIVGLEFGRDVS